MDFDLNTDQQAILEAVNRLLAKQSGAARAIELNKQGEYDHALHDALDNTGYSTVARDFADGERLAGLESALVVEAIARSAGVVSAAAQMLVAPAVAAQAIAGPVALCTLDDLEGRLPVRFAGHARHLLLLDHDRVQLLPVGAGDFEPVRSSFGYPMGRLAPAKQYAEFVNSGTDLGETAAATLSNWWRLSLAVEAVGTMDAALHHTVEYLKQRRQFGRAIGSFQAVQHRLSECAISVEASRWLAREAAFHGAPAEGAAAAAAFALDAADQVFTECHQLSGAIGFTREFDLHVWSMRLPALRQELAGVGGARRALVAARWGIKE